MATEKETILIKVDIDHAGAEQELQKIEGRLKSLTNERKKANEALKKGEITQEEYNKTLVANRLETKRQREEQKKYQKEINTTSGSLNAARQRLIQMKKALGDINQSTAKGRKEFMMLAAETGKLNAQILKQEKAYGVATRNVGNYGDAFQQATGSILPFNAALLASPIGAVTASMLAFLGVGASMFNFFREFDTVMSKVQAATGASAAEMDKLKNSAIEFGETSKFTAREVGQLQLELAKLGFTTSEIVASTEAVLDLATATDSELGRSAEVVAQTLNQFSLEAEESGRVADVMAKSFSSSALDIEKFAEGMKNLGKPADLVGVSLEQATSLLSVLADNGVDASTAGTQLKNVFIELSNKGLSWSDAMAQINNSQNKLQTANDLFGKRAVVVAATVAENTENINDLANAYDNAAGSASHMADIVGDNLQGDLDRLSSAYEGLIARGGAVNTLFRGTIQFVTSLIGGVTKLTGKTKDFSEGLNDEVKGLEESRIKLNNKLEVLKKSNLSNEQRKMLIEQINKEYPNLIKNQLTEFSTIKDINKAQKTANELLKEQIRLKRQEALATETINKILDLEEEQKRLNEDILKQEERKQTARGRESRAADERIKGDKERLSAIKSEIAELEKLIDTEQIRRDNQKEETTKTTQVISNIATTNKVSKEKESLKEIDKAQIKFDARQNARQNKNLEAYTELQFRRRESEAENNFESTKDAIQYSEDLIAIENARLLNSLTQLELTEGEKAILIFESEQRINDIKENARQEDLAREQAVQQQKLAITSGFLGAVAGLFDQQSNEYKILASAQALIDTYAAANAALKTGNAISPIFGTISAATAVATGLANVAKINNVQFEDGGMIEGKRHSEGGVPFTVRGQAGFEAEGGEYIMSRNTVDRVGVDTLNAMNFGNYVPSVGTYFADGGQIPLPSGVNQVDQGVQQTQAVAQNIMRNFPEIVVGVREFADVQNTVAVKEQTGSI